MQKTGGRFCTFLPRRGRKYWRAMVAFFQWAWYNGGITASDTEGNMELSDRKRSSLLILLCWAVYTCAYLGKYSYTANTLSVIADYGITKAEAGLASTLFFAAYGTFQIIHGFFCGTIPKKSSFFPHWRCPPPSTP